MQFLPSLTNGRNQSEKRKRNLERKDLSSMATISITMATGFVFDVFCYMCLLATMITNVGFYGFWLGFRMKFSILLEFLTSFSGFE